MHNEYCLFHGALGNEILSIIGEGKMRPNSDHKVFYSEQFEDALKHGADLRLKASFAFKANVILVPGASLARVATHGNPYAVVITTALPLPTKITELYVRLPHASQVQIIRGIESIRAYLMRTGAGR